MIFDIEQYYVSDDTPGKIKGHWHKTARVRKSPVGARNLCFTATRRYGLAHRIVNPYNNAVLATFKFNLPNKVVTTYNSPQFEELVVSGVVDDRMSEQE